MFFRRRNRVHRMMALFCVLLGAGAVSGCHNRSGEDRVEEMAQRISRKLDFSTSQKSLLMEITNELKLDIRLAKEDRQKDLSEVERLIVSDSLDTQKAKTLFETHHTRMSGIIDKYLPRIAGLHKTLTPTQKKDLVEMLTKLKERWE